MGWIFEYLVCYRWRLEKTVLHCPQWGPQSFPKDSDTGWSDCLRQRPLLVLILHSRGTCMKKLHERQNPTGDAMKQRPTRMELLPFQPLRSPQPKTFQTCVIASESWNSASENLESISFKKWFWHHSLLESCKWKKVLRKIRQVRTYHSYVIRVRLP
jgi:hypothetical protein